MFIDEKPKFFPKSEADLFSTKSYQNNIESSQIIEFRPVSTGFDDCIEFLLPSSPDYLDLSLTKLYLKVQIVDHQGNPPKNHEWIAEDTTNKTPRSRKGTHVAPGNDFLSSLFSQVLVFLNHKCITSPGTNHAYRSYIEKLLNYDSSAKQTHLASSLFIEDTVGRMNDFENRGSLKRMARMSKNGSIELLGYLHTDLSNSNKLIMQDINIGFKLYRNKAAFSLMTNVDVSTEYKINIIEAKLLARKVKASRAQILANDTWFKSGRNAKYNIKRNEIKSFTIPSGTLNFALDNVYISQIPKRVLMFSILEEDEFNYRRSPFLFQHFNLKTAHLTGDYYSTLRPVRMNMEQQEYIEAFDNFNDAINTYFHDTSVAITPDEFTTSCFILGWDLTSDGCGSQDHLSVPKSGTLRIQLEYSKALEKNIKLMLYAEYDNYISIDASRNAYTDYAC